MSQVYNPEADIIEAIERMEMEARSIRKRVEHHHNNNADKRVLNKQLQELQAQIDHLKSRLP